jgi:hypothetical protein
VPEPTERNRAARGALQPEGWQAAVTPWHYLGWVRGRPRYADGRRIVLLLDSYSAHRCEEVRCIAEMLKIDLVFVPAGCTRCAAAVRSLRVEGDSPPLYRC